MGSRWLVAIRRRKQTHEQSRFLSRRRSQSWQTKLGKQSGCESRFWQRTLAAQTLSRAGLESVHPFSSLDIDTRLACGFQLSAVGFRAFDGLQAD